MNPLIRIGPSRRLVLLLALIGCAYAAEAPHAVPPDVAKLLTDTAQAEPAAVIAQIDAAKSPLHPLLLLSRAQARLRLMQTAKDAEAQTLQAAATVDFTDALKLDATLTQAHLGLAQCAAARQDWLVAARQAGLGIDIATADRGQITFLASVALKAEDWRLATLAAQYGILRFSDDAPLRTIELAVMVHSGRAEDARQAVLALLAKTPTDGELWRHLAWSAQQTGRNDEAVAALEAALALTPDDRGLRRTLAEAQLSRGQPQAALLTIRPLIGEPPTAEALADDDLLLLASRAAADGGGDQGVAQARAWLNAVPEPTRSRAQRLQAARLAVRAGDQAEAGAALDALIAAGEADPVILTWAASLADLRGESAQAETLYLRASASDTPAAGPAALRLAALYLKQGRRIEASTLLATYLAKKPDDTQARALQAQLDARPRHERPRDDQRGGGEGRPERGPESRRESTR